MSTEQASTLRSWIVSRSGWICLAFLGVVGFFLWEEHKAHILGIVPYLLLLLCPILHLLHGGHGGHGGSHEGRGAEGGRNA